MSPTETEVASSKESPGKNIPLLSETVLTDVKRNDAVGRVGQRGFELQRGFLQAQDVGEDVLVEASDQVKLAGIEEETRLLQLDGDGHFARASVNREMRNLQTEQRTRSQWSVKDVSLPRGF